MRDLLLLILCAAAGFHVALAQETRLEWTSVGISRKLHYYTPARIELSTSKPSSLIKEPPDLVHPLFGTLELGPMESPTRICVIVDEPPGGEARLFVDTNANGDLTDDPVAPWSSRRWKDELSWSGSASVRVAYRDQMRELGLQFYRFDANDPKRAAVRTALFYYRDFGYSGEITLNKKSYMAVLVDETARGDFRGRIDRFGSGVSLLLDLNGDGAFDMGAERFDVKKPFNVEGTTYVVDSLSAEGSPLTIRQSEQSVAEIPVPPTLAVGSKAIAFEDRSTAGQLIRFPKDYAGKLVMLDFWATWCGPCCAEVPNLVGVYEEFHPRGFDVLGISLEKARTLPGLEAFLQKNRMTWPQLADGRGWDGVHVKQHGVHGIPTAWLVDGSTGVIVAGERELRGPVLRATLERLLARDRTTSQSGAVPPSLNQEPENAQPDDPALANAAKLATAGKLLNARDFQAQLAAPRGAKVELAVPSSQALKGREIAQRARLGYLRVGWYYTCSRCGRWHVHLSGSYAIAKDTIATVHHALEPPTTMRVGEGHPIAVRGESEVIPITAVLADDRVMDVAILRLGVSDLSPLAITRDIEVGDPVFCLSDPRGLHGYFTSGIVNRIFSNRGAGVTDSSAERLNVSTDWAPGSSGAALLDRYGNVVGHVASISVLFNDRATASPAPGIQEPDAGAHAVVMAVHEAVSAKSVLALVERP